MKIGNKIIELESVDSTNLYAARLMRKENLKDGTIFIAKHQTAGMGTENNKWYSSEGNSILITILLKPESINPGDVFIISKLIAVGVYDFCVSVFHESGGFSLKWPNDIYFENKKLGGILISNSIEGNKFIYSLAGIGINVNENNFPENLPNPISLSQISKATHSINECLESLINSLNIRYGQLLSGRDDLIEEDYLKALYMRNQMCRFLDCNQNEFFGIINNVDEYGRLIVNVNNKTRIFNFKEIRYMI